MTSGSINVENWLKKNNLLNLRKTFLTHDLTVEELCECNNDELIQVRKDYKWDSLDQQRIIQAVNKIQMVINNKSNEYTIQKKISKKKNYKKNENWKIFYMFFFFLFF